MKRIAKFEKVSYSSLQGGETRWGFLMRKKSMIFMKISGSRAVRQLEAPDMISSRRRILR